LLLLAQAEPGGNFQVSGIYERDRHLLEFLEQRGIRPGAKVHVAHRNYDNTLALTTGAGRVSLGVSAAEKVWVKPTDGKGVSRA
jgi:Fe2+ transport system protein FeoA